MRAVAQMPRRKSIATVTGRYRCRHSGTRRYPQVHGGTRSPGFQSSSPETPPRPSMPPRWARPTTKPFTTSKLLQKFRIRPRHARSACRVPARWRVRVSARACVREVPVRRCVQRGERMHEGVSYETGSGSKDIIIVHPIGYVARVELVSREAINSAANANEN